MLPQERRLSARVANVYRTRAQGRLSTPIPLRARRFWGRSAAAATLPGRGRALDRDGVGVLGSARGRPATFVMTAGNARVNNVGRGPRQTTLEPDMVERGQLAAEAVLPLEVQLGDGQAFAVGYLGEDRAPGIDDHRVAVRGAALAVMAGLRGCEHVGQVLDGARTQEDLPMVLARAIREGRRYREHPGPLAGQAPVQLGEAHVVADREADAAGGGFGDHDRFAALDRLRFLEVLEPGHVDVEEMDLAIGGERLALGSDQHRR